MDFKSQSCQGFAMVYNRTHVTPNQNRLNDKLASVRHFGRVALGKIVESERNCLCIEEKEVRSSYAIL